MTLTQSEIESQLSDLQSRVTELEGTVHGQPTSTPEPANEGEDLSRTATNPELDPHQPGVEPDNAPEPSREGAGSGSMEAGSNPTTEAPAGSTVDNGTTAPQPAADASEKPLYVITSTEGSFTLPDGYTDSGLRTPDGKLLLHFSGDTAGEPHTGGVDGLEVYADDVVPATTTDPLGQAAAS